MAIAMMRMKEIERRWWFFVVDGFSPIISGFLSDCSFVFFLLDIKFLIPLNKGGLRGLFFSTSPFFLMQTALKLFHDIKMLSILQKLYDDKEQSLSQHKF